MTEMSKQREARLTKVLLQEKEKLWTEVRRDYFEKVGEELQGQRDIPLDAGDRSLLDLLEDTGMTVADIRRQQLTRMDEALRRLEDGTYGICEDCGEEIEEKRLEVVPYAPCCVACQAKREEPTSPAGRTL